MDVTLPAEVVAHLGGHSVVTCVARPIGGSTGAATGGVTRVTGRLRSDTGERPFSVVRKEFRPLTTGRHAAAAADPRHWAYWRREPAAYAAGILPEGPGLAAPSCYGVVDDVVYLADVTPALPPAAAAAAAPAVDAAVAARRLGAWQAATPIPDLPWLAGHQLAQRIAVSELDWSTVDAPAALRDVWTRRDELLARLEPLPRVLSHGDFHLGNLVDTDPDTTTVLDWGTLGVGPAGADLAHLALSSLDDRGTRTDPIGAYLTGSRLDPAAVRLGYRVTMALTAASRLHWMRVNDVAVPTGYVAFVTATADPSAL